MEVLRLLAMADVDINIFFPVFAQAHVPVAFLVPTPTGYEKSIMDAIGTVRELLYEERIHDYSMQGQGPQNKVMIKSYFVLGNGMVESAASLYRPVTKKGDPRIWFSNLKKYCFPRNLLALTVANGIIYVFNLSNPIIANSLFNGGYVANVLNNIRYAHESVAMELLNKIRNIHNRGYIPSITPGDPGVGDTLENALGIQRNHIQAPDYKGIELKATRLSRAGYRRASTRNTLFTKVPDEGMTYRQIIDTYGKWQTPRYQTEPRFQLYETFRVSRPNAYGLQLDVDVNNDRLVMLHVNPNCTRTYVSSWILTNLKQTLLIKHHETFWVKAEAIMKDGIEYFRYDKILHTKNPNTSLVAPLLETDKITVDLAAHYEPDGKWRDHGMLFKMKPEDITLLLSDPIEYDLTVMEYE